MKNNSQQSAIKRKAVAVQQDLYTPLILAPPVAPTESSLELPQTAAAKPNLIHLQQNAFKRAGSGACVCVCR